MIKKILLLLFVFFASPLFSQSPITGLNSCTGNEATAADLFVLVDEATTTCKLTASEIFSSSALDIWVDEAGDSMTGALGIAAGNAKIVTTAGAGALQITGSGAAVSGGTIDFGSNTAAIGISRDGVSGGYDYDGAFVLKQKASNPDGDVEFLFIEEAGDWRFALPKSAADNATYNPRSFVIAGPSTNDANSISCAYWGFDNLDCDTGTTGADLGVQDDLEVLDNFYISNPFDTFSMGFASDADNANFIMGYVGSGENEIIFQFDGDISFSDGVLFIDTTGNEVGINTSTPFELLHVYRNDTSADHSFVIEQDGTGDASMEFLLTATRAWGLGVDNTDDSLKIDNNSALFSSPEFEIKTSNDIVFAESGGDVSVGIDGGDGKFHVWSGSAGSVTADAIADEGVFENAGDAGISILASTGNDATILFGIDTDNSVAIVGWSGSASDFFVGPSTAGVDMILQSGNGLQALKLHSDGSWQHICQASAPFTCNSGNAGRSYCDSTTTKKPCWCDGSSFIDLTGGAGDCT